MDAKQHPGWALARYAIVGGTLALMLHINYMHGFVAKDFVTIVVTLASAFGMTRIQSLLSGKKEE